MLFASAQEEALTFSPLGNRVPFHCLRQARFNSTAPCMGLEQSSIRSSVMLVTQWPGVAGPGRALNECP